MATPRTSLAFTAQKTQYSPNGTYSNTRQTALRSPFPYFPFNPFKPVKTQNRDGAGGRLRRIKARAVMGDGYRNGVVPNSGGADPNTVLFALAYTRGQGSVASPKVGAN